MLKIFNKLAKNLFTTLVYMQEKYMKIQSITPFNFYNLNQTKNQKAQANVQNNSYNPITYRDLSFTARVCWTPEEFYQRPCNKNGMPDLMKQYLNADYEDRQHVRPQDMMAIVYDDINETKNLEQVRRIFSDEPLFKNLTDKPNKSSRTGILAEIDLMKEENKSLFKNGKDNLGHYLLKKIYLEGKTLKEINEDFKKDVSVHYKGLSDITYDTTKAFGIKFPNVHFWNSFTHNRDNFKYVHKPRKSYTHNASNNIDKTVKRKEYVPQKGRFDNVKDWEIDKLANALNKGRGRADETKKQLKKSSVKDEASLNFVAKYMSEINSVVLEKLQVSPEMAMFFENDELLNKSQKEKFEAYWQEPERRELRSLIMKDTIKWFFDAYGVDGQNEEFKELIEYAHNIKPNRIAKMKEHQEAHDIKQKYYDEMFAELDAAEKTQEVTPEISFEDALKNIEKKSDVQEYVFQVGDDKVVILSNLKKDFAEKIKDDLSFYPSAYANKYAKFILNNSEVTDKYMLTKLVDARDIELPEDERLLSRDELNDVTFQLGRKFNDDNIIIGRAAQQAILDIVSKIGIRHLGNVYDYSPAQMNYLINSVPELKAVLKLNSKQLEALYSDYNRPISAPEARKIAISVIDMWKNYDPNSTLIVSDYLNPLFYSISKFLNNKMNDKETFRKYLEEYIMEYGGSARVFLKKDASDDMLQGKFEDLLENFALKKSPILASYASLEPEGFEYLRIHNLDLYQIINDSIKQNYNYYLK